MQVNIQTISGPWRDGYVLDKQVISSTYLGNGMFDTLRTDIGQALYLLKYRNDTSQVEPISKAFVQSLSHVFSTVGFVVPMPPSQNRSVQPLSLLAKSIAQKLQKPYFDQFLIKTGTTPSMKDLDFKEEKLKALSTVFSINDMIEERGPWDVLLLDDLYDSGASLESATQVLSTSPKIRDIYVGAITRTGK